VCLAVLRFHSTSFFNCESLIALPAYTLQRQVLRQKRMYENQRETLYNQQFNMEQTRFTVESIQDTVQTVQVIPEATSMLNFLCTVADTV
jgi:hypothetical protein